MFAKIVNINWNILLLTVHKKLPTLDLPGHSISIKKKIEIYIVYLSTKLAKLYEIIFTILNQSSGGIGIRLKIANIIFIIENLTKKIVIAFQLSKNISFIHIPNIFEKVNNNIIHPVASTKFVAGHASATISSHFIGSL